MTYEDFKKDYEKAKTQLDKLELNSISLEEWLKGEYKGYGEKLFNGN